MAGLSWYLDITEYDDNDGVENTFSVYVAANYYEVLTIAGFVERIETAMTTAEVAGDTDRTYEVTARVDKRFDDEIVIKYVIKCCSPAVSGGSRKFSIDFETGPHGLNGPMVLSDDAAAGDIVATMEVEVQALPVVGTFPSYYSAVTMVQDKPPMPPNVEFVPYMGVNDEILILLNGQAGTVATPPIVIKGEDVAKFEDLYVSQGKDPSDFTQNIEFKSDDPVHTFQVFRTTVPPGIYSDFEGHQLAEFTEYLMPDVPTTLASYLDSVVPNTKYYYCFRSIDVHENLSNPTEVYEVEIVDNNGQIYPIIKLYESCKDTKDQSFIKTGKRFIYIAPSTRHTDLDDDVTTNTALDNSLPISEGTAPEGNILGAPGVKKVWGEIFKVRVTSKKTGRKVDFNLIFKNTGVPNP